MMKQLTIVHTESHRQWSGQEMRVFHEICWMAEQGHRVMLVAPGSSPLYEAASKAGLERYPAAFKNRSLVKDYLSLRRLLKKIKPEVLNTHGNLDAKVGLSAAWGLYLPCVIRSRHHPSPVKNNFYNQWFYGPMCNYIFTTAEKTTRRLIYGLALPADKVVTIPSGIVPPEQLKLRTMARKRICTQLGVDQQSRFVGYVGRIAKAKGVFDLLAAFGSIYARCENSHLVMVGAGGVTELLKEKAREQGVGDRVHLPGFQFNPWPYFRAFDCYVHVTHNDGVPQSVLQAMYAQTPVIAADVGGIPDVVLPNRTGMLLPPRNPTALASAIHKILTKPDTAQAWVEAAYEMVCKNHLLDTMGQKILSIYDRQING